MAFATQTLNNRGRWDSNPFNAVWVVLGFVPVTIGVAGCAMGWHRVLRKRSFD